MKIAIHHRPGSFSERWIQYCEQENIVYKIVNCYDSDIVNQVKDCDALMWHHTQGRYKDILAAKSILLALEHTGMVIFPDFKSGWHFEDKIAQKYLLEAIEAPLVPSYIFYDKKDAIEWACSTTYPKVFKLRSGAGSRNVMLVRDLRHCTQVINKAFSRGFSYFNSRNAMKDDLIRFRKSKNIVNLLKLISRPFITPEYLSRPGREKGYVYFQDFIPENKFDIRVVIVANKAFALKRFVRPNDFRASGSGNISYNKDEIDEGCIQSAFKINERLQSTSVAFDFVFDENNKPLVVEISYGYAADAYDACPGYWDSQLNWHESKVNFQAWMVENVLTKIRHD